MQIAPTTVGYTMDDLGWLASHLGTDVTETITLDVSAFPANRKPDGRIPSGTVLGKITATGLYGPYEAGASDGRETAVGFLFGGVSVPNANADAGGALLERGKVKVARLPFSSGLGAIDSAGRTDLAPLFKFVG